MHVVNRNTLENPTIVNQSPATDPRLEKTTNLHQLNYNIDEDGRQIHKIYHIHNFGTVYMDSLNSWSVTMENCANNNVRRVNYHRPKIMDCLLTDSPRTRRTITFSVDYIVIFSWASLAVACLAFFIKLRYWGKDPPAAWLYEIRAMLFTSGVRVPSAIYLIGPTLNYEIAKPSLVAASVLQLLFLAKTRVAYGAVN
ncbi:hypothetical protein BYT27DRAFT_7284531 [Phlegmacium glaucopus]|nr:hypothetical protein BYT27DRAFT_7284531 [Phlegmacium glaucopus]